MYHQSTLNVWGSGTLTAFVARQDILKGTFHCHPVSIWLLIEWMSKYIFLRVEGIFVCLLLNL